MTTATDLFDPSTFAGAIVVGVVVGLILLVVRALVNRRSRRAQSQVPSGPTFEGELVSPVERSSVSTDRQAARIFEDLRSWIQDEDRDLEGELRELDARLNASNLFHSGERSHQRVEAKRRRLHQWRDRERAARRELEDLGHEGENPFRGELDAILATWRKAEPGGDGSVIPVDEPQ